VTPTRRSGGRSLAWLVGLAVVAATVLVGCSGLIETRPTPTPTDFGGIVAALGADGISIANPQSGDAGCSDANLIPTAIEFSATGLGVTTPIPIRIYIFGSDDAYQRRRSDVDACVARWATDPATFEMVDATPFVVAGQGPWPPGFKAAVQHALRVAAGTTTPAGSGAPPS
jgi:hypothetical protein